MKSVQVCIMFCFTFLIVFIELHAWNENTGTLPKYEKYIYQAIPTGSGKENRAQNIDLELYSIDSEVIITSTTINDKYREIIGIKADRYGKVLSGKREIHYHSGGNIHVEGIWRSGRKVFVQRFPIKNKSTKEYVVPDGMSLAVDVSLLLLLRSFPFDRGIEWRVYMVDFSQHSTTIIVRQSGIENVTVPAGDFECYRIELLVNIPLLRPRITIWLSKENPHYLVKQRGMRGPFAPSYITSLVSVH